ncbi:hypothetical protein [Inquilinus ginsengisoli]|uniref:hypothetical protein n=1 Tax=Inquilinus ginsengisoli TaxID=363840 RepID=UPI003D1A8ECE
MVIILIAAVVVGELGRRFLAPGTTPAPAAAVPATTPATAAAPSALPAGSRITSITVAGDRAVILITLPGGGQEVRSIDPRTGAAATLLTTAP